MTKRFCLFIAVLCTYGIGMGTASVGYRVMAKGEFGSPIEHAVVVGVLMIIIGVCLDKANRVVK